MLENIIFGLLVVIVLGGAIFTCFYESGGSIHKSDKKDTTE